MTTVWCGVVLWALVAAADAPAPPTRRQLPFGGKQTEKV
jgi:hypothetical protein